MGETLIAIGLNELVRLGSGKKVHAIEGSWLRLGLSSSWRVTARCGRRGIPGEPLASAALADLCTDCRDFTRKGPDVDMGASDPLQTPTVTTATERFQKFREDREAERAEEAANRVSFRKATLRYSEAAGSRSGYVLRLGESESRAYVVDNGTDWEYGLLDGDDLIREGVIPTLDAARNAAATLLLARRDLPPPVRVGTLGTGRALHILVEGGGSEISSAAMEWRGIALCGAKGMIGREENDVDARAVRVRGREICKNCRTLLDRALADDHAALSANGRPGETQPPAKGEQMPATKRTSSRAPSRKRSATATASRTEPEAATGDDPKKVRAELVAAIRKAVPDLEVVPNKDNRYDRFRVGGKSFGLVFAVRKSGVPLQIPKALLNIRPPAGHGFKKGKWGMTRTITSLADIPAAVSVFETAAEAARPKEEAKASA